VRADGKNAAVATTKTGWQAGEVANHTENNEDFKPHTGLFFS
jgi:hypothetical protein